MDGIPSKNRDLSVEENIKRFKKEMTEGNEFVSLCYNGNFTCFLFSNNYPIFFFSYRG